MRQRFWPDRPLHERLRRYVEHRLVQRKENHKFYYLLAAALLWIYFLTSVGYMLATQR